MRGGRGKRCQVPVTPGIDRTHVTGAIHCSQFSAVFLLLIGAYDHAHLHPKASSTSMRGQASILIVDDDASSLKTLSFILKRKGYSVTMVGRGEEAVEEVMIRPYRVTLMDIRMPGMDGLAAFRRIQEVRPGAAVIMMTAYSVEDLVRAALEEGACGVLYKPLDIDRMLALIERVAR